jgi:hypothetical protein
MLPQMETAAAAHTGQPPNVTAGKASGWEYSLLQVPWQRQIGPSCGLAALRMVRDFFEQQVCSLSTRLYIPWCTWTLHCIGCLGLNCPDDNHRMFMYRFLDLCRRWGGTELYFDYYRTGTLKACFKASADA